MQSTIVSAPSDAPPRPPHSRRFVAMLVFVLGVLVATGPLATDLYLPAFPQIASEFAAPESLIQLTLTSMMVGLAMGQLALGPMSDAWGRRIPLLTGIAVFTAASVLCAVAPTPEVLVVLRFIQGAAGAAGAVISRAVVRDVFEGDDMVRFFSRLMLVIGVAPLLGPVLGGQLLLVGSWRLLFVILGAVSAISFLLVLMWLPESLPARSRQPLRPYALARTFAGMLRDLGFIVPAMVLALAFGMLFTYVSVFSFVSQEQFGASAQQFSLMFAFNALGLVGGTQVNGFLVGRVSTPRRLLGGLLISVLSTAAVAVLAASGQAFLLGLTVLLFLMMFGVGFVMPNATAIAIASQPPPVAGTASALIGSLQFAVGGGVAAVAGVTVSGGATLGSMAAVMLTAGLASVLLYLAYLLRARRRGSVLAAERG